MKPLLPALRINRNIVECKEEQQLKTKRKNKCINRNIVECKVRRSQFLHG